MLPSTIPNPNAEHITMEGLCRLADRWGTSPDLMRRVIRARGQLPFDIWIFSGARTREQQEAASMTPFDLSTHADTDRLGCPRIATGIDLQPVSPAVRQDLPSVALLGGEMVRQGFRWGGGAPVGPDGIPQGDERWHFDLGRRTT